MDRGMVAAALVLGLCALPLTVSNIKRTFYASTSEPESYSPDWRELTQFGIHLGAEQPLYPLVVYTDYECPACRKLQMDLNLLRAKYPKDLAVAIHHIP